MAVLVAKIARFDYPKEWPELFPTLIQGIESNDSVIQHRSLLTMHHVVKAISSKRLAGKCHIITQCIMCYFLIHSAQDFFHRDNYFIIACK